MSKIKSATRAFPEQPSLENLKKQARALLNAIRAREPDAEARVRKVHPRVSKEDAFEHTRFSLSAAQLVLAREYGFVSWPKLKQEVTCRRLVGAEPAFPAIAGLSRRRTLRLVERLYQRLELVARRLEWMSLPDLAGLKEGRDLPGLISAALAHCDPVAKEAMLQAVDADVLVAELCAALESVVRRSGLHPLGGSESVPDHESQAQACLVVLHASRHPHLLGRRYPLTEQTTKIGRHTANRVLLHSDSVSREHARIERRDSEFVLVDQASTNGCFVNEAADAVAQHVLHDGDRVAIGDAVLVFLASPALDQKYRDAIEYISRHDALTGTLNQKAWLAATERQIFFARGGDRALSALLIDIDQLQEFSERIGRLGGNALLLRMARVLREELGADALIGRCGAGQFGVTLLGTDVERASEVADRLRKAASSRSLSLFGETVAVTVSIGVATLYRTTGSDQLIEDAHAALQRARGAGRNAVRGPGEVAA